MSTTRGLAAAAMLAGLAIGLAAPASAANELSGHYIETETTPHGYQSTSDWYITPCGDGCAAVATTPTGQPWGQAHLANGQWSMESHDDADCVGGGTSTVRNALTSHITWDPVTLAGTNREITTEAACGQPAGFEETNTLQLRKAP
jgi:hypothetical protein